MLKAFVVLDLQALRKTYWLLVSFIFIYISYSNTLTSILGYQSSFRFQYFSVTFKEIQGKKCDPPKDNLLKFHFTFTKVFSPLFLLFSFSSFFSFSQKNPIKPIRSYLLFSLFAFVLFNKRNILFVSTFTQTFIPSNRFWHKRQDVVWICIFFRSSQEDLSSILECRSYWMHIPSFFLCAHIITRRSHRRKLSSVFSVCGGVEVIQYPLHLENKLENLVFCHTVALLLHYGL